MIDHEASTAGPAITSACASCGYLLQGLESRSCCPECGLAIELSLLSDQVRAMVQLEDRILARKDYYRRNRAGASLLAFGVFGLVMIWIVTISMAFPPTPPVIMVATSGLLNAALWTAVAFGNHARYQHATSIEYYRQRLPKSAR